jgi:hypothetical protein
MVWMWPILSKTQVETLIPNVTVLKGDETLRTNRLWRHGPQEWISVDLMGLK